MSSKNYGKKKKYEMTAVNCSYKFGQKLSKSLKVQVRKFEYGANSRWLPEHATEKAQKLTLSSSFSIPLGIWGTALLIAEYSGRSGNSSDM